MRLKRISLNTQIVFGALSGVLLGLGFAVLEKESAVAEAGLYIADLVGTLFIDMLKMVVIPLIFTSIAVGVANLGRTGRCTGYGKRRWAFLGFPWPWRLSSA